MEVVAQASQILLRYFHGRLMMRGDPSTDLDALSRYAILDLEELMNPVKALCTGTSVLSSVDHHTLQSQLKSGKVPPHVRSATAGKIQQLLYLNLRR